jgi:hypothetical protein
MESRDARPKIFELEGFRPPWATIIGEEKWTMVGEGGGKGIEDMRVKMQAPSIIAKEPIEFAHCWIIPLI